MAITNWDLRVAVAGVYIMAHNGKYRYGDSKGVPPCSDGIISCDRLIARALYNLGFKAQPAGGITVLNMEQYLLSWGFTKITDPNKLTHGDIVLMKQNGTTAPNAMWHTFLIDAFYSVNKIDKYDCGSQSRIQSAQPFKSVPLDEWTNRSFYCGFRSPGDSKDTLNTAPSINKPAASPQYIQEGFYRIRSAMNNQYLLDVAGGSLLDRANVQLYKDNNTDAQVFLVLHLGSNKYAIMNKNSRKYLNVQGGTTTKGTNIQQYKDDNTDSMKFYIYPSKDKNFYTIQQSNSNLVFDIQDGIVAKKQNIRLWKSNNTTAQQWIFDKV